MRCSRPCSWQQLEPFSVVVSRSLAAVGGGSVACDALLKCKAADRGLERCTLCDGTMRQRTAASGQTENPFACFAALHGRAAAIALARPICRSLAAAAWEQHAWRGKSVAEVVQQLQSQQSSANYIIRHTVSLCDGTSRVPLNCATEVVHHIQCCASR